VQRPDRRDRRLPTDRREIVPSCSPNQDGLVRRRPTCGTLRIPTHFQEIRETLVYLLEVGGLDELNGDGSIAAEHRTAGEANRHRSAVGKGRTDRTCNSRSPGTPTTKFEASVI